VGIAFESDRKGKPVLHVDVPTLSEVKSLTHARSDACVSIYLETTPLTQDIGASRIQLGNLAKQAREQLEARGFDKRRLATLIEHLDDMAEDDEFWRLQANSLAVLATPDWVRTFRLANRLISMVEVSDRFHLKPLLRAVTFPHMAFVLSLSENAVRLVEVFAELPPETVKVADLPKDAASAVGKSTLNSRSASGRIQGSEGQKVRFRQYLRQIDSALRPVLAGRDTPLILAATEPLASLFRSVNTYPHLLPDGISDSPDRLTNAELAALARPILDKGYARDVAEITALYEKRAKQGRATADLSDAARAATFGAIEMLLVDINEVIPGTVDEVSGAIQFAEKADASNYGVVDEITGRALSNGARVLGVRRDEIPGNGVLAAILRYAV